MWRCSECGRENNKAVSKCTNCQGSRPSESYIGERISEWVIKKKLGEGGMAVVFLAHHAMLGNPVAIKLLRPEVIHKRDVVERFRTEALAASHLRHENVIQIIHFGKQEGIGTYMVLEFLEGMDLESKLYEAPLSAPYVLGVAKQICSGLEAAHAAGIIHRDLKPSNIFLVPRANSEIPTVKILDFGIAKIQESHILEGQQNLTRTGTVLGTPYYLSPEQLRRRKTEELGSSVDIYAFGVILYQMFTGKLPLEEDTLAEQMAAILTHIPPLAGTITPSLAGTALELFLHRLLNKNPEDRPTSISEAWTELTQSAGVLGQQAEDNALRQRWESTFAHQLTEEINATSPTISWSFRIALILLLLITGGWLGYRFTQKPPTPLPRLPITRPAQLPTLTQWQNEGVDAFNSKNYKKALERWSQVLQSQDFKKGSKHYNPKLYRSVSEAWRRLKHRYASLQALKKYQQEVGTQNLTPAEKQQLQRLEDEILNKQKLLEKSHETFRSFLQRDNYRDAFDVYSKIKELKDPSQPTYIQTSLLMARELAQRFPHHALAVYQDMQRFNYAIPSPQLQKEVQKQYATLQQKMAQERQAHLETLRQSFTLPARQYRRHGVNKTLSKTLRYADDIQSHLAILQLAEEFLQTHPQRVLTLLQQYQRILSSYQKRPDWQNWLKPLLEKANLHHQRIQALSQQYREWSQIHQLRQKTISLVQQGKLSQAHLLAQQHTKRWETSCASSTRPEYCKTQQNRAQLLATQLQQLLPQWQQIKLWATVTNEWQKARASFLSFNQKLNQFDWASPDHRMIRMFKQWENKHRESQKILRNARDFEKKEDWIRCWSLYKKYIEMYPKAHNVGYARHKRCQCNCKQVVPFETCDRRCIPPKER